MRRSPELRPTAWDALVALAVILLAAGCALAVWGGGGEAGDLTVVVSADGAEVERIDLTREDGERTYSHNGYTLTVELRPDGAPGLRVTASDCPTRGRRSPTSFTVPVQDSTRTGPLRARSRSSSCPSVRVWREIQSTFFSLSCFISHSSF